MLRLAGSSNPDDVNVDAAVRLLAERAVLTRSVCRELLDAQDKFDGRRPSIALGLLLQWVQQNFPECVRVEPHASDGLDRMIVPEKCRDLMREIEAGAQVGEALFMIFTADTMSQYKGDEAVIRERLTAYWANHPQTAYAPSAIECWTGMSPAPPKSE